MRYLYLVLIVLSFGVVPLTACEYARARNAAFGGTGADAGSGQSANQNPSGGATTPSRVAVAPLSCVSAPDGATLCMYTVSSDPQCRIWAAQQDGEHSAQVIAIQCSMRHE